MHLMWRFPFVILDCPNVRIEKNQMPSEQLIDRVSDQEMRQSENKQQQRQNNKYNTVTCHVIMKEGFFVYDDCQIMAD